MSMAEPLFEVRGVTKTFGETTVVDAVDLRVQPGEVLAILGPSGAGKSTLLRMLNALEEPTAGDIRLDGRDLRAWDVQALRRRVAMLFQMPTMFGGTVRDNLATPLRLRDGRTTALDPDWCRTLLASVELDETVLDRVAATLSIGQQQRVAFARALILRPAAILLDEPTASLDPTTATTFLEHLGRFTREQGLTVVLVTHQVEHAARVADRVMLLVGGRAVTTQSREEFFAPDNAVTAPFLRGELGGAG